MPLRPRIRPDPSDGGSPERLGGRFPNPDMAARLRRRQYSFVIQTRYLPLSLYVYLNPLPNNYTINPSRLFTLLTELLRRSSSAILLHKLHRLRVGAIHKRWQWRFWYLRAIGGPRERCQTITVSCYLEWPAFASTVRGWSSR